MWLTYEEIGFGHDGADTFAAHTTSNLYAWVQPRFFINDHLRISDFKRNYEVYVETRPVLRSSISSATVGTDHIGAVTCFSTSIKVRAKSELFKKEFYWISSLILQQKNWQNSNASSRPNKRSKCRRLSQSQELWIINMHNILLGELQGNLRLLISVLIRFPQEQLGS